MRGDHLQETNQIPNPKNPHPTHTQSPVKTTQTKHPHKTGSEQHKRPYAQNRKTAEHHPKQPPTPGQTLKHHQLQHPGQSASKPKN